MIRTNLQLAFASVRGSKIRTLLTVVAVIIGISSFTVVTTTIEGLKKDAASEINDRGGNLIQLVPGNVIIENEDGSRELNFTAAFGSSTIADADLADIEELEGIKSIAPLGLVGAQVSRDGNIIKATNVIATTPDYPAAFSHEVEDGTFLAEDPSPGSRFVVVGQAIVDELYGGELALGTFITIRGEKFTVVGSMAENDSVLSLAGAPDLNNSVYISLKNAQKLSGGIISLQEVDMQLEPDADADKIKSQIEEKIRENHGGEKDFTVLTQDELIELTDSVFGIIKQAGLLLSGVMLFVSSIVILLIMLITVRERTREIGVRKSIGATNTNILMQFLAEALTISWIGSIIGIMVGLVVGLVVKNLTDITPVYTVSTLVMLVAISTAVGMIAGVVPAWIAARKDPVESIRHE